VSWVFGLGGVGGVVAGVVLERPGRKDLSVRYESYRMLNCEAHGFRSVHHRS